MDRNNVLKKANPNAKKIDIYKTFLDENSHVFDRSNVNVNKV